MDIQSKESINLIEYISDNFVGLLLLISVFFIIYFVDHINRLNAMIFQTPLPPGLAHSIPIQKISKRHLKKR
jgi:hypothetical protein